MSRMVCFTAVIALLLSGSAYADFWHMGEPVIIHEDGTRPSVWNGTIAFLDGNGGPVMFYDGSDSTLIFEPVNQCWEPSNANGSIAWRHLESGASSNEILRWADGSVENVSNSPGVIDGDLDAGSNGDLIWSQNHTWLTYYDAASDTTFPLDIRGVHPSLYITDEGVATYAYQDPDTDEVFFFDGTDTYLLGNGNCNGAYTSVWDGSVAWVGQSEVGSDFTKGEIYFWIDGQTQRITNDDDAGGIADEYPTLWNYTIIWSRGIDGLFSPKLFMWDGFETTQLTFSNSKYASLHNGMFAWYGDEGLYLADLFPIGDLDGDHDVDLADLAELLSNWGISEGAVYEDGDLDGDGDVDMIDLATLLGRYGYGT